MKNSNGTYTWFGKVTAVSYGKVAEFSEFTLVSVVNSFIRKKLGREWSYLVIQGHHLIQVDTVLKVTDNKYPGQALSELEEVTEEGTGRVILKRMAHWGDPYGYLIFHDVDECHKDRRIDGYGSGCTDPSHFFVHMNDLARAVYCATNFNRGYGFDDWGDIYYPMYIAAGYLHWTNSSCRAISLMYHKLYQMSEESLITVWVALGNVSWSKDEMYDVKDGISMDTWAQAVYSVGYTRGIKLFEEERKRRKNM